MPVSLLKNCLLFICVCCKPPVFLTLSILVVSSLLTLIFAKSLIQEIYRAFVTNSGFDDTYLAVYLFLVIFGLGWMFFFASLARYEIMGEFPLLENLFQYSRRGFRCLPVTLTHLALVMTFERVIFDCVDRNLPRDQIFQKTFDPRSRQRASGREIAILVYSIWSTAVSYSFAYFVSEMTLTTLTGSETLIEILNNFFIKVFVKLSGIDLSDYPAGEAIDNPIERTIMGQIRRNEDLVPPALAEYAINESDPTIVRNRRQQKDLQYHSWNTLR